MRLQEVENKILERPFELIATTQHEEFKLEFLNDEIYYFGKEDEKPLSDPDIRIKADKLNWRIKQLYEEITIQQASQIYDKEPVHCYDCGKYVGELNEIWYIKQFMRDEEGINTVKYYRYIE